MFLIKIFFWQYPGHNYNCTTPVALQTRIKSQINAQLNELLHAVTVVIPDVFQLNIIEKLLIRQNNKPNPHPNVLSHT